MYWKTTIIQSCISLIVLMLENPSSLTLRVNRTQIIMNYDTRPIDQTHQIFSSDHCQCCYSKYFRFDNQSNWTEICCIVLLSSTKIMTKYRRQRKLWRNIIVNEPLSRDENETRRNVNAGHVTMTIMKCIMQYRWRIKTRLNVVYKIKTMLKCLFIFVDQNETKRNVITLFRLVLSRFLCLTHGLTSGADIRVARFSQQNPPNCYSIGKNNPRQQC